MSMLIIGIDEAGRGPLAGPVVAAAVILNSNHQIQGLADSKQLSAKRRDDLAEKIRQKALYWSIAQASVEEIDSMNILNATLLAMHRSIKALAVDTPTVLHALIDGNRIPKGLACTAEAIIKGDQTEPCISAASILAKTHRDRLMTVLHDQHPAYGFAAHKGYGTRAHIRALERFGPLASIHRRSFAPVKRLLEQNS